MECSNDVHFAVSWILTQNHEKPWIIAFAWVRFLAKMWPTLKSTFRTSFERYFHADCKGTIPCFISHSCTKIQCVFHLTLEAKCFGLHTHSTYVRIGMVQSWTIAICMNGTFKWCPFLILSPNTNKGITYGFDSVWYSQITMHQTNEVKKRNSIWSPWQLRYFPYTQNILTSNMYTLTRLL